MIGVTTIQTILYHLPPSNLDFVRVHCSGNLKYGGFLTPGTSKSSILIGFSIINRPILRKPVSPSDGCWNSCDVGWCVAHVGTLGVSLKVGYPPVAPHYGTWKITKLNGGSKIIYVSSIHGVFSRIFQPCFMMTAGFQICTGSRSCWAMRWRRTAAAVCLTGQPRNSPWSRRHDVTNSL